LYAPSIANALRGIAPDCTLEKTATFHNRDCTGRRGTVAIRLTGDDHFTALTISLVSMILPEAKGHLDQPLLLVVGASGRDQVIAKLGTLETGQAAELAIDKAKVSITAGGTSRIAPAYTVTLTW
jgi:hypothetical protein